MFKCVWCCLVCVLQKDGIAFVDSRMVLFVCFSRMVCYCNSRMVLDVWYIRVGWYCISVVDSRMVLTVCCSRMVTLGIVCVVH